MLLAHPCDGVVVGADEGDVARIPRGVARKPVCHCRGVAVYARRPVEEADGTGEARLSAEDLCCLQGRSVDPWANYVVLACQDTFSIHLLNCL